MEPLDTDTQQLLQALAELGVIDPDILAEGAQRQRLQDIFNHLEPSIKRDLLARSTQELQRNNSGLEAFATRYGLTPAEHLLLVSLCDGLSTNEHALKHNISKHTVRTHMQRIREKTGAGRQAEVVRMALQDHTD